MVVVGEKEDPLQGTLRRICTGQEVRGFFSTENTVASLDYHQQLAFTDRPWVFPGRVNPLYWVGRLFTAFGYLGTLEPRWRTSATLPEGSEDRERMLADSQHEHSHFGGWNSLAGHMLTGLQGRARCSFRNLLVVTDQDLLVAAVSGNEKLAQVTFRTSLTNIAWTRKPHREKHRIQFGFTDGTWHTMRVEKMHRSPGDFTELFPQILPHTAGLPDVLTASQPIVEGDARGHEIGE